MDKERLARNLAIAVAKTVMPNISWDQLEAEVIAAKRIGRFWTLSAEAMLGSMRFLDDPTMTELLDRAESSGLMTAKHEDA